MKIKSAYQKWKYKYKKIIDGYRVCCKIKKEFGRDIRICVSQHPGLGDAYLAGLYLNQYYEEDFVVTTTGTGAATVYQYLGVKNICTLSEPETEAIILFCQFVGIAQDEIRVLHHQALLWHTGIAWNLQGVNHTTFADLMEAVVFPGTTKMDRHYPEAIPHVNNEEKWQAAGIKKGESIILFPYANTLSAPPIPFWERLVMYLSLEYNSIASYASDSETCISGTIQIYEDISNLVELAQYAGTIIGVRNGLIDILGNSDCKKIILYPKKGTEDWIKGSALNYWSINHMGYCNNAIELEWSENNLQDTMERILFEMHTDGDNNNTIRGIIDQKLRSLRWAQSEWDTLYPTLDYDDDEDYIVAFPSLDKEYNLYGMKYLDTFLQRQGRKKAIILTGDPYVKNNISTYSENVKKMKTLGLEQMKHLVDLYQFHMFHPKFIIVSLDEPFCRHASGLIGKNGITIEQMIAIGVYSILPFRQIKNGEKII